MPIYEYQCEKGHVFEVLQTNGESDISACRHCEKKAHRVLSPANFVLKGSGFYVNDYKKKDRPAERFSKDDGVKPKKQEKASKGSPSSTSQKQSRQATP